MDSMNNLAPVVLFVYNRLEHTKQTIEALQRNHLADQSDLFIFSDGPKNISQEIKVAQVREFIKRISGFRSVRIIEQEINIGLANSIISGITKVIDDYGKVIVLEDDIITSEDFLVYMNKGLDTFQDDDRIWSVTGYGYPIDIPDNYTCMNYLFVRPCSWGWGTWKSRWEVIDWEVKDFKSFVKDKNQIRRFNLGGEDLFDMLKAQMNGEINSWAIRWAYAAFKSDKDTIHPCSSKVVNIGFDGTGEHCRMVGKFDVTLTKNGNTNYFEDELIHNKEINVLLQTYYKKDFIHKVWTILSNLLDFLHLNKLKLKLRKVGRNIFR